MISPTFTLHARKLPRFSFVCNVSNKPTARRVMQVISVEQEDGYFYVIHILVSNEILLNLLFKTVSSSGYILILLSIEYILASLEMCKG